MMAAVVITIACVSAYVYIRVDDRKAQMRAYKAAAAANGIYAGTVAVAPGKRFQFVSPGAPGNGGAVVGGPSGYNSSFNSTASFNLGHNKHDLSSQSLVSEEGSLSFRYSDSCSDKSRPLLSSRPPGMQLPTGVLWAQQQSPIIEEDEHAIVEIGSSAYETLPYEKNLGLSSSTPMSSFNQGQGGPKMVMNTTNSSHSSNHSGKSAKSPAFPPPPPPLPGAGFATGRSPQNKATVPTSGNSNMFCHVDVHHVQSSNASDANNSDSYDEFHFFSPGPQHV